MSSIMRRRNGLIAWSVMGRLLSGGRVATPHLQTGRARCLSPLRALGCGALPRERFSPLEENRKRSARRQTDAFDPIATSVVQVVHALCDQRDSAETRCPFDRSASASCAPFMHPQEGAASFHVAINQIVEF